MKNGFRCANYNGYEIQRSQEAEVCDFMQMIRNGTYDESGEIVLEAEATIFHEEETITLQQKLALSLLILGSVILAVYAAVLRSKLEKLLYLSYTAVNTLELQEVSKRTNSNGSPSSK